MKQFVHKVLVAVAPVIGVSIGIAILNGAHVPFPPALSEAAWPQWAVFAAVMYTSTAFCLFVANRLAGDSPTPPSGASSPAT